MKTLAVIGFALSFLNPILSLVGMPGFLNNLLTITAAVLIILAYWQLSRRWGGEELRRNFNRYFFTYVAMIILGIVLAIQVFAIFTSAGIDMADIQDPTIWQDPDIMQPYVEAISSHLGRIMSLGLLLFLTFVFNAWFFYRMNAIIATYTRPQIDLFRIGGLLYFIGALAIIVFGLGFFLMWISYLLLLFAFRNLPSEPPVSASHE